MEKVIYFHVGISKTGSTFLQQRVFPFLKNIHYIPTRKYFKINEEISGIKQGSILVSREFDRQFEREVDLFAKNHKNVVPIIVFRRHDQYLASQYRRFVKNGFKDDVKQFFDIVEDHGFFKKIHFNFSYQVQYLKQKFNTEPLVFIYEDLKNEPQQFIENFVDSIGGEIDLQVVDFSTKHGSYNEKQLKVIKTISQYINLEKRRVFNTALLHILWRFFHAIVRYGILNASLLIPRFLISKEPLIDEDYLNQVKRCYVKDWEYIMKIKIGTDGGGGKC